MMAKVAQSFWCMCVCWYVKKDTAAVACDLETLISINSSHDKFSLTQLPLEKLGD